MDNVLDMQVLSMREIKQAYPEQWVLIGNPELSNPEINGLIANKLTRGVVLFASKDKREIAYKAKDLRKHVESTVCIFTGEIPQKRLFLL
jgi:hypothetical protein